MVAPGADPTVITFAFEGADQLEVDPRGDLVAHLSGSEVRLRKPRIYQEVGRIKKEIPGSYTLKNDRQVGFQVAAYDRTKPLVIDPVLVYSTFLGGSGFDEGLGIAVDAAGNAYVTGLTISTNFPATTGAFDTTFHGAPDAFVTKLNAAGAAL